MKKTITLLLALCLTVSLLAGCGGQAPDSPEATSPTPQSGENTPASGNPGSDESKEEVSELLSILEYDAEKMPESVKPVVYVEGSWYDMGYQYASQVPEVVKRETASGISGAIERYGWETSKASSRTYIDYYNEHAPELVELYHGMADAIEMDFEDFVIGMISFAATSMTADDVERDDNGEFCSSVAAWGEATENGTLIVGQNWDTIGENSYYTPCVVAHPETGNSFISNNGFRCTMTVNDKGLVCTGSSGQSAGEGDNAIGIPVMTAQILIAANCDTAEEASKLYIEHYRTVYGDNLHVEDINGGHFIVEVTAAHYAERTAGDFGEIDYLIATNDFMCEEMLSSLLPPGSGYEDCRPRYWTEERVLLDSLGSVNAETVARSLGQTGYYENDQWVTDNWSLETGLNSPEAMSPFYQNVLKTISVPENNAMYIMNGCGETLVSMHPNAVGNYVQLLLCETPADVNGNARSTANFLIYDAGSAIAHSQAGDETTARGYLSQAKAALVAGDNYTALAGCASDSQTARELYGKATSYFLKAQSLAQLAMGDCYAVLYY